MSPEIQLAIFLGMIEGAFFIWLGIRIGRKHERESALRIAREIQRETLSAMLVRKGEPPIESENDPRFQRWLDSQIQRRRRC